MNYTQSTIHNLNCVTIPCTSLRRQGTLHNYYGSVKVYNAEVCDVKDLQYGLKYSPRNLDSKTTLDVSRTQILVGSYLDIRIS
jgi:hypothetical protein